MPFSEQQAPPLSPPSSPLPPPGPSLNEEQAAVVAFDGPGVLAVLAPAGAGKTMTLTRRVG